MITSIRIFILFLFLFLFFAFKSHATYLHQVNGKLYDADNREVRLTGANWFGFETSNLCLHGLWSRDWKGLLLQVKQMGFNCLRIPWCNKIMDAGSKPNSITFYGSDPLVNIQNGLINVELKDKNSLEVLDVIVRGCSELGIKIILDNHSRDPDGYMNEKLWYTPSCPEMKWIDDWKAIAGRYKNNPTVVACDLDNEPHGKVSDGGAQWGTGVESMDWKVAAEKCGNAILSVNPDVLILIEGVEQVGNDNYWWGGNLTGVSAHPIELTNPQKLVYSPHEYGPEVYPQPWFEDSSFPSNMESIWNQKFGYIYNKGISHLLVGEFGIRDVSSFGGKEGTWFQTFMKYMGNKISWTFWCLNPNSGDTGGLLQYDWLTVENWKLDLMKPYLAPMISSNNIRIVFNNQRNTLLNNFPLFITADKQQLTLYNPQNLQDVNVRLFTIDGRAILSANIPSNTFAFSIPVSLGAGVYSAMINGNPKQAVMLKILK